MLVLDDLLFRPIVGIADALHSLALDECYDIDALEDERKELELLYELDEIDDSEYDRRREDVDAEIEEAREVHRRLTSGRVEVREL